MIWLNRFALESKVNAVATVRLLSIILFSILCMFHVCFLLPNVKASTLPRLHPFTLVMSPLGGCKTEWGGTKQPNRCVFQSLELHLGRGSSFHTPIQVSSWVWSPCVPYAPAKCWPLSTVFPMFLGASHFPTTNSLLFVCARVSSLWGTETQPLHASGFAAHLPPQCSLNE